MRSTVMFSARDLINQDDLKTIGGRIQAERLTFLCCYPEVIAEKAGIPVDVYSDIEWGRIQPTPEQIQRIADAIGCTVDTLTRQD